jgi:2,4-dienoyl-CoA reductase (NADPH2)
MLTPLLFEPIRLGGLYVPNRITMPPMHTNLGGEADGIAPDGVDFYIARAKGGYGLLGVGVIDAYYVEGAGSPHEFFLENDVHVRNYARMVKEIKKYGSVPYAQIGVRRVWPVRHLHREKGVDRPSLAEVPVEEIEKMIHDVVETAKRAAAAGFQAIDILGVGGSGHSIFTSRVFNDRTDEWGGTPEKRIRFAVETVRSIKKALGEDFPVFYRFHGSEFLKGGYGIEGAQFNARKLEEAGVCFFNVTGGGHATSVPQLTPNVPQGAFAFLAAEMKKVLKGAAVAASNRNSQPLEAEAILRRGWADMISLGRQALADADWPIKVKEGRFADVRHCVACNECMDIAVLHNAPVRCLVNPRQGSVSEVKPIPRAKEKKKVGVVGSGVAGLQFALTARQRGHDVTVIEKKSYVGGMWHHAAAPVGRQPLFSFLEWLMTQCTKAGVRFRMDTLATPELLRDMHLDILAVSPGSDPVRPDVPGVDLPHVQPAILALEGRIRIGERVVIVGGGGIGVEIAPFLARRLEVRPEVLEFLEEYEAYADNDRDILARKGHQVTLLSRQKRIGGTVGGSTRWVLTKEVALAGVNVITGAAVREITPSEVKYERGGIMESVPADTVLLATGLRPNYSLYESLNSAGVAPKVVLIGDPDAAMHAIDSVTKAFRLAVSV